MDKANVNCHTENRAVVIFAITGDPRKEELVPTLCNLYAEEILKGKVLMVCLARSIITKKDAFYVLNN